MRRDITATHTFINLCGILLKNKQTNYYIYYQTCFSNYRVYIVKDEEKGITEHIQVVFGHLCLWQKTQN